MDCSYNAGEYVNICKPLGGRMELLKTTFESLQSTTDSGTDNPEVINRIGAKINMMSNDIQELLRLLAEQEALQDEMKEEETEISHLAYKLLELNNENGENQDAENNLCPPNDTSEQATSCVDFSPMVLNNAPSYPARDHLTPQSIAFDIAYLREEEYKELPKYMVGRLTLQAINSFIDVVNDAFSKKYNILSKRMSALKSQELKLFEKYKHQQNFQLKGKHFIIEEDIAREFNRTGLEKKSYSFLMILRHTKRLVRNQIDGIVVYIASSHE